MLIKSRVEALGLDYDKLHALLAKVDELDAALNAARDDRNKAFVEAADSLVYIYTDGVVDEAGEHQLWSYLTDEQCSYTVCHANDATAIAEIRRKSLEALAARQREKLEATLKTLKEIS